MAATVLTGQAASPAIIDLTSVTPRIFSPNADGANDVVVFRLDNPQLLPLQGEIFDLSGAKVADMKAGPDADVTLKWDGKDDSGRAVPGGIYVYQIEAQGDRLNGTVVVAR